jgi:hypothetical protein
LSWSEEIEVGGGQALLFFLRSQSLRNVQANTVCVSLAPPNARRRELLARHLDHKSSCRSWLVAWGVDASAFRPCKWGTRRVEVEGGYNTSCRQKRVTAKQQHNWGRISTAGVSSGVARSHGQAEIVIFQPNEAPSPPPPRALPHVAQERMRHHDATLAQHNDIQSSLPK